MGDSSNPIFRFFLRRAGGNVGSAFSLLDSHALQMFHRADIFIGAIAWLAAYFLPSSPPLCVIMNICNLYFTGKGEKTWRTR
jgi:hypothetical protein